MKVRALLLVPLALLAGCRTSTRAAPPPLAQWEAPLTFTEAGLPAVEATVNGQRALFLLDTQAQETTVEAWLSTSEVPLQIGAQSTRARPVATVPGHEAQRLGGTVSPHRLLSKGALVLDFPGQKLFALNGDQNVWLLWLDSRSPRGQAVGLMRAAPIDAGLHVRTRVGDGREVVTQLATAQLRTAYTRSLFDASLVKGDEVAGLYLKLHEAEFGPLDVAVVPELPSAEGRLGLDLLRPMVLVLPVQPNTPIWFMTPRE